MYARLFGSHSPESLDAIRRSVATVDCCRTKYFLGLLPVGYEVPVSDKADPWVDPVAGCLHKPPQGAAAWLDLDALCGRVDANDWPGSLHTALAAEGVSSHADVQMIKRLVEANSARCKLTVWAQWSFGGNGSFSRRTALRPRQSRSGR